MFSLCNLCLFIFTSFVLLNPLGFITLLFSNYSQFFFPLSCLPRCSLFFMFYFTFSPLFLSCVFLQVPLVEISLFMTFLVISVLPRFSPFRFCTLCSSPFYSSHFCFSFSLFALFSSFFSPPSFCLPSSFFTYLLQKMPLLHFCLTFSPFFLHVPPFSPFFFFCKYGVRKPFSFVLLFSPFSFPVVFNLSLSVALSPFLTFPPSLLSSSFHLLSPLQHFSFLRFLGLTDPCSTISFSYLSTHFNFLLVFYLPFFYLPSSTEAYPG